MTARLTPERLADILARAEAADHVQARADRRALLAELDAVRAERDALLDAIEYAVNAWDDGDMHRGAIDGLRALLDAARPNREGLRAALDGKGEG